MKVTPECIPCLLKRVIYEVGLSSSENALEALRECTQVVAEKLSDDISSVEIATGIHRAAYSLLGTDDPYQELKRKSNEVALNLMPDAERFINSSEDRLRASMIVSIIGNLMDFGISGSLIDPELLKKEFLVKVKEPLSWDDSGQVADLLDEIEEAFFLADNCGEIIFDRLLMREIRAFGPRIILVIKGKPILTDVTRDDIIGLELEQVADEIVETEGFAIGIDLWSGANDELIKRMKRCELIIAKGMANFEALSEHSWKRIAYLMRVKCDPVANALGVKTDANLINLIESDVGF